MALTVSNLNSYTDLELALMVLLGYFGNGQDRKNRLGSRYAAAQAIVEQILRGTVPAGSSNITKDQIRTAVNSALGAAVKELTEDIINDL